MKTKVLLILMLLSGKAVMGQGPHINLKQKLNVKPYNGEPLCQPIPIKRILDYTGDYDSVSLAVLGKYWNYDEGGYPNSMIDPKYHVYHFSFSYRCKRYGGMPISGPGDAKNNECGNDSVNYVDLHFNGTNIEYFRDVLTELSLLGAVEDRQKQKLDTMRIGEGRPDIINLTSYYTLNYGLKTYEVKLWCLYHPQMGESIYQRFKVTLSRKEPISFAKLD